MNTNNTDTTQLAEEKKYFGNVTAEQYEAWCKQYTKGGVYTVQAIAADGTHLGCYLTYPDRETYARCLSLLNKDMILESGQTLIMSKHWLGGSEELRQMETEQTPLSVRKCVNQVYMTAWQVITDDLPAAVVSKNM